MAAEDLTMALDLGIMEDLVAAEAVAVQALAELEILLQHPHHREILVAILPVVLVMVQVAVVLVVLVIVLMVVRTAVLVEVAVMAIQMILEQEVV